MKHFILLFLMIATGYQLTAQKELTGFSYQAVVRSADGEALSKKPINVEVSLYNKDSSSALFTESHMTETDRFGQLNIVIGNGDNISGDMSKLDWDSGNVYYKIRLLNERQSLDVISEAKLLAVPFAYYAKSAGSIANDEVSMRSENSKYWHLEGNIVTSTEANKLGSSNRHDVELITSNETRILMSENGPLTFYPSSFFESPVNFNSKVLIKDELTTNGNATFGMHVDILKSLNVHQELFVKENARIGKDFTAGGFSLLEKDLEVLGVATFNGGLTVGNGSDTYLSGGLRVDGIVDFNNAFNVNNMSPTHLTGSLDVDKTANVDGATTLQSSLDVNNMSPTHLTGTLDVDRTLNVDGSTSLQSSLDVNNMSPTHLTGTLDVDRTLNVDGATNLQSTLDVRNMAATHLSGSLDVDKTLNVDGNTVLNGTLTQKGKLTIQAGLTGAQNSPAAYALEIDGGTQGALVRLNTQSNDNNFLFFVTGNTARGAIEGQTSSELTSSFEFIWYQVQEALMTAFQVAMIVVDVIGLDDADAAIVEGVEMVDIIASWAIETIHMLDNVGVSYESGSADYAEWLKKENTSETFSPGDIVSVVGGKITKEFKKDSKFMVVSSNPIVLGNMPGEGESEDDYEMIAFMGQVPVKVRGLVNIGDYIIASNLQDGFGTAVHPDDMNLDQYHRIVGVAWSDIKPGDKSPLVNVAIGINSNDLTVKVQEHERELNSIKTELNSIISYLENKDPQFDARSFDIHQEENENPVASSYVSSSTDNEVNAMVNHSTDLNSKMSMIEKQLRENPELIDQVMSDAREMLDKKGVDYTLFEQTNRILTDVEYLFDVLKEMK